MNASAAPVLVMVEHRGGTLRKGIDELLATAGCWPVSGEVVAVAFGPGAETAARESTRRGARQAWWSDGACAPVRWLRAVEQVARETGAKSVLFPDSTTGRDLAPRLAARLNGCFVPGVLAMEATGTGVRLERSVFGGRFIEEYTAAADRPIVMTWRRGDGSARESERAAGVVRRVELAADPADGFVQVTGGARGGRNLTEADIVVCGGRGMGSRAGFELVHALADALGGAAAASRAAVDAGFAPVELQVGQSGKTVSPRFYFALGISGSLQHRAGMRTSRCIVAVNNDPTAPILRWADYGIVGDVAVVVPALMKELREA